MKKVVCPCCEGKGVVEFMLPLPVAMAPIPSIIYRAVKARPGVLNAERLIAIVYGDRPDGGPDTALQTIHVQIHRMNKALAAVGERLKANRRGAGATYSVVKLDVV